MEINKIEKLVKDYIESKDSSKILREVKELSLIKDVKGLVYCICSELFDYTTDSKESINLYCDLLDYTTKETVHKYINIAKETIELGKEDQLHNKTIYLSTIAFKGNFLEKYITYIVKREMESLLTKSEYKKVLDSMLKEYEEILNLTLKKDTMPRYDGTITATYNYAVENNLNDLKGTAFELEAMIIIEKVLSEDLIGKKAFFKEDEVIVDKIMIKEINGFNVLRVKDIKGNVFKNKVLDWG